MPWHILAPGAVVCDILYLLYDKKTSKKSRWGINEDIKDCFAKRGEIIMNNIELIEALKDKDNKKAYELSKEIAAKSAESNEYYELFDEFICMLSDKSSYVRTRGFCLACAQARWDNEGRMSATFDDMLVVLNDEKPTVVRQCLGALAEVILYRNELCERIEGAIKGIDLSKYKDSMAPLIEKDINELLKKM